MSAHNSTNGTETPPTLRREAGLFQVITYGVGNIIGAGIYVLVGDAAGLAGNLVWLAFLVGAIAALFTGLTYAELASMYPKAASEYIYLGRAYGNRLIAFLTQWTMLITEVVAAAAVSIGFAGYFSSISGVQVVPAACALLFVLTIFSLAGVKESLRLNTILSLVAIGGLVVVIVSGIPKLGTVNYTESPSGWYGVFAAAALVFFSYIGFDNISNLSEETKKPEKTIPRGLLISVLISMTLYTLIGVSVVSLAPWQNLANSEAPLAYAGSILYGANAYNILAIAALLTTVNTVLVLLIVSSRIIYGMARENALPSFLGRVSKRTGTPYLSSILILMIALTFVPLGKVDSIAKITSFGSLLTFALINLALLHLRRVAPHLERPFKAPLNVGWVSLTAVMGVISCLVLLTQFDLMSALLGVCLPISGSLIFWIMRYKGRSSFGFDSNLHETHEAR
jgi:APA family basic amino acid/polyamine antiporter